MPRCNRIIPRFGNRGATEYIGEHTGQTVSHGNKDKHPDGDVEVPAGKDAKVEYKNGTFCEARCGAVEYSGC
jgi:hypothetical protein